MIRFLSKILVISIIFLSSCGLIIIVTGQSEEVDKFKVDLSSKPSELIYKFTNETSYKFKKNYFITYFDIYCDFSYQQIYACNKLYNETNEHFEWVAITIYDTTEEAKYRKQKKFNDDFRYQYKTYYNINGLKSSLRNLYYQNEIPDTDIVPMSFIIVNDTIVRIIRGAINTEFKYEEQKNFLDSIITKHY